MTKRTFFYLALALFTIINVSVRAQVRIGGTTTPHSSAVLDLNKTSVAADTVSRGLALPRVKLKATNNPLPVGATASAVQTGLQVYNIATDGSGATAVTPGIYYWNGSQWVLVAGGGIAAEVDGVIGNEVKDVTNSTLVRSGSGTDVSPYTLARAAITGDVSIPAASNAATLASVTQTNTTSTAAPAHGATFTAIDAVTRDTKGRVTGVNTKTITMPTETAEVDGVIGNEVTNAANATLVRSGSGTSSSPYLLARAAITGDVSVPAASNAATLATVTQTNTTSSVSPAHGASFTAIDAVTRDTKGRVTGVNTKTVTLPADNNTTYTGSTSITLSGTSFQRAALTGDVTAAANSNATTIANNAVNSAKIADGAVATVDLADNAVTTAKIANATILAEDINIVCNTSTSLVTPATGFSVTEVSMCKSGSLTQIRIVFERTVTEKTVVANGMDNLGTITSAVYRPRSMVSGADCLIVNKAGEVRTTSIGTVDTSGVMRFRDPFRDAAVMLNTDSVILMATYIGTNTQP
jgi:hypothetical protein